MVNFNFQARQNTCAILQCMRQGLPQTILRFKQKGAEIIIVANVNTFATSWQFKLRFTHSTRYNVLMKNIVAYTCERVVSMLQFLLRQLYSADIVIFLMCFLLLFSLWYEQSMLSVFFNTFVQCKHFQTLYKMSYLFTVHVPLSIYIRYQKLNKEGEK